MQGAAELGELIGGIGGSSAEKASAISRGRKLVPFATRPDPQMGTLF